MARKKVKTDLMTALDFTAEDLEANRHGVLTQRQRTNLAQKNKRLIFAKTAVSFFILALNLVGLGLSVVGNNLFQLHKLALSSNSFSTIGLIWTVGLFRYLAILSLRNIISSLRERFRLEIDLRDGVVCSVLASIVLVKGKTRWDSNRKLPRLITPPVTLKYNDISLRAFKTNLSYRIFFIPNVNYLLSAEILSDENIAAIPTPNSD
jgi:hypothetical protein